MNVEFEFESHPDALLITPLVLIGRGECENPECQAEHWVLSLGWLIWDVSFFFEFGGGLSA